VVVGSVLKEINGDKRIETLIKGETLLNEAVVLVIFNITLANILGEYSGYGEVIGLLFKLPFGGIAIGLGFAIVLISLLSKIINDTM